MGLTGRAQWAFSGHACLMLCVLLALVRTSGGNGMPDGSATDLMKASRDGDTKAVEDLLAAGADVNAQDSVCEARGRA